MERLVREMYDFGITGFGNRRSFKITGRNGNPGSMVLIHKLERTLEWIYKSICLNAINQEKENY